MRTYALDEEFSLEAEWHVPSRPELEPKRGILTYEPGQYTRIDFKLSEPLSNKRLRKIGGFTEPSYDILKGYTEAGESILAIENQTVGFFRFYPRAIVISNTPIDWEKTEDILFRRISTHYTHLEEWWSTVPFEMDDEKSGENKGFSVKYTSPPIVKIPINTVSSTVKFVPELARSFTFPGKIELEHRIRCTIESDTAQPLNLLFDQLQHLQDLLTLLIGEPVRKLDILAFSEENQIFHVLHAVPVFEPLRKLTPNSVMFPAQKAINQLPQIVDLWFQPECTQTWNVIRDVYLGVRYKVIGVPRFIFLALMQVLEAYHRRKFGGEYLSKELYEPIQQALIGAIPADVRSDHRDSLKSRIQYGYQYSQRKRFRFLLDVLDEKIQRALKIKIRDSEYIKRIFATRNYFTHYDEADAHLVFEGHELDQVISRLTHMIDALLFRMEMGISEEQVLDILKRRKDLGHLW